MRINRIFYITKDKIILWKKLIGIEPFFLFSFFFCLFHSLHGGIHKKYSLNWSISLSIDFKLQFFSQFWIGKWFGTIFMDSNALWCICQHQSASWDHQEEHYLWNDSRTHFPQNWLWRKTYFWCISLFVFLMTLYDSSCP